MGQRRFSLFSPLLLAGLFFSIVQPLSALSYSGLLDAHLLKSGMMEFTPNYASLFYSEGNQGLNLSHIGFTINTGGENSNFQLRYDRIKIEYGGVAVSTSFISFGAKTLLLKDRLALYIPVGTAFGKYSATTKSYETQPTLIYSHRLSPNVEIHPSLKFLIPLFNDDPFRYGMNLGFSLGPPDAKWRIRPEAGAFWASELEGFVYHLGAGFSIEAKRFGSGGRKTRL